MNFIKNVSLAKYLLHIESKEFRDETKLDDQINNTIDNGIELIISIKDIILLKDSLISHKSFVVAIVNMFHP